MPKLFFLLFFTFANILSTQAQEDINGLNLMELEQKMETFRLEKQYTQILPYATVGYQKATERGIQDTSYARMAYFLGFGYQIQQNFNLAIQYLLEAKELQQKLVPNHIHLTYTLNNLAVLYKSQGAYQKSLELQQQVTDLRLKLLGEEDNEYIGSLSNLASLYNSLQEYELAEKMLKKCLALREKSLGNTHIEYANSADLLALLYSAVGRQEEAEPLYKKALEIRKKELGVKHPYYAYSLNNLALLLSATGRKEQALELHKEAHQRLSEIYGPVHIHCAGQLINMSNLYISASNFSAAEQVLLEAMPILEKIVGTEHSNYAVALNNLGIAYTLSKKYKEAEALQKKAIAARKISIGTNAPNYASSLANLAEVYYAQNQFQKTLPLLQEALKISENNFGPTNSEAIIYNNNLAKSYLALKDSLLFCQSIESAIFSNCGKKVSLNISEPWKDSLFACDFIDTERFLRTLDHLYVFHTQQVPNSQEKLLIISKLADALIAKKQNSFESESDKLRMLKHSNLWMQRALINMDIQADFEAAFNVAEKNKAALLMEAIKTERAYSIGTIPKEIEEKERAIYKQQSQLKAALLSPLEATAKDSLLSELNNLNIDIKNFKKQLETDFPKYAQVKYNNKSIPVESIQNSLDEQTALLEFTVGDSAVFVFYIDKKERIAQEILVSKFTLEAKVNALHEALSNYNHLVNNKRSAYLNYVSNAHWIYQKILEPILKKKTAIKKLFIVPDGALSHIPFEALLTEEVAQKEINYRNLPFLINQYAIRYNYTASLLAKNNNPPKTNNQQLLAIAADYTSQDNLLEHRLPAYQQLRAQLIPLPAAQKEVAVLAENYQGLFATQALASESFFKKNAPNYAVLHLAMHGLLNQEAPILSSLAFSEDNDSLEDNFLHAYEISKLSLNADLIVLSACETGYGKFETGNGVASLARSFMYAGTPSLVVSLWQVNDFATSELMKLFYEYLHQGLPKDEALHQAKLNYLQKAEGIAAHPAFWSPFILIGDDAPVLLTSKGNWTPWFILLGIAVLTFGFVFWKKKNVASSDSFS